jgi:hypothetical protein
MAVPLSPQEHAAFEHWFQIADADGDGYVGVSDAAFFKNSELPFDVLAQVRSLFVGL